MHSKVRHLLNFFNEPASGFQLCLSFRNSLVIMGGNEMGGSSTELDTVFQYDPVHELWKRMDKKLKRRRKSFVAVSLPEHFKCSALEQKITVQRNKYLG